MPFRPTAAALLLPGVTADEAAAWLDETLRDHGYEPCTEAPPPGVPLAEDEWLGFVVGEQPRAGMAVVLAEDPSAVFRVATWLSARRRESPLAAWRRYLGGAPVLKHLLGGRPLWKDGDDPDHEVLYDVPRARPADAPSPEEAGLPERAGDLEPILGSALRSYREAIASPRPGERTLAWLRADSPLAR
ncbi:MAG: hypothetical protein ACQEXJ_17660 [Myxococcota bacterium]